MSDYIQVNILFESFHKTYMMYCMTLYAFLKKVQLTCIISTEYSICMYIIGELNQDLQYYYYTHVRTCSIIRMFYYGQNDISLGEFLQRYCFR